LFVIVDVPDGAPIVPVGTLGVDLGILVTLVPFTMSGLIFSLTSLDYLGFGLPPQYATWGRLLQDGLSNLSAPWLVTATFVALVGTLVLITFVGEAVREAIDPKKFTYYR
jgi:microcin C transport system permease protein